MGLKLRTEKYYPATISENVRNNLVQ